jgi:hypothetical protein
MESPFRESGSNVPAGPVLAAHVQSLQTLCHAFLGQAGFPNLAPGDPIVPFERGFFAVFLVERTIRGTRYCTYTGGRWAFLDRAGLLTEFARCQQQMRPGGQVSPIYVLYNDRVADPRPPQGARPAWLPCECLCVGFPHEVQDQETRRPVPAGGHIDLAGGRNLLAAGEIRFSTQNGTVARIDNSSGHFQPWEETESGKHPKSLIVAAFRQMLTLEVSADYGDMWTVKKREEAEKAKRAAAAAAAAHMKVVGNLAAKLKSSNVPKFAQAGSYAQAARSLAQAILRAANRQPTPDSATVQQLIKRLAAGESWQQVAVWYAESLNVPLTLESLQ